MIESIDGLKNVITAFENSRRGLMESLEHGLASNLLLTSFRSAIAEIERLRSELIDANKRWVDAQAMANNKESSLRSIRRRMGLHS